MRPAWPACAVCDDDDVPPPTRRHASSSGPRVSHNPAAAGRRLRGCSRALRNPPYVLNHRMLPASRDVGVRPISPARAPLPPKPHRRRGTSWGMMPNGNEAKATLCTRLLGAPASSAELVQKMHAITSSIREGGVRRSAAAICIALPGRHAADARFTTDARNPAAPPVPCDLYWTKSRHTADCPREIYRGPLDAHSRELECRK